MNKIKLYWQTYEELKESVDSQAKICAHLGLSDIKDLVAQKYGDITASNQISILESMGIKCVCELHKKFDEIFESGDLTAILMPKEKEKMAYEEELKKYYFRQSR